MGTMEMEFKRKLNPEALDEELGKVIPNYGGIVVHGQDYISVTWMGAASPAVLRAALDVIETHDGALLTEAQKTKLENRQRLDQALMAAEANPDDQAAQIAYLQLEIKRLLSPELFASPASSSDAIAQPTRGRGLSLS